MKILAVILLVLYGVLNVAAGMFDALMYRELPMAVDLLLVLIGVALVVAGIAVGRRAAVALQWAIISLSAAFALALFNERILGLGHPSHHIVRALYTALAIFAVYKTLRRPPAP